ncbi:hypothetical protein [Agromyces bauzanensis]
MIRTAAAVGSKSPRKPENHPNRRTANLMCTINNEFREVSRRPAWIYTTVDFAAVAVGLIGAAILLGQWHAFLVAVGALDLKAPIALPREQAEIQVVFLGGTIWILTAVPLGTLFRRLLRWAFGLRNRMGIVYAESGLTRPADPQEDRTLTR